MARSKRSARALASLPLAAVALLASVAPPACFDPARADPQADQKSASGAAEEAGARSKRPQSKRLAAIYADLEELRLDRCLAKTASLLLAVRKGGAKPIITSRALTLAGYSFLWDDNLSAAINCFHLADRLAPDDITAAAYLTKALRMAGRFDEERKLLDRLQGIQTSLPSGQAQLVLEVLAGDALRRNDSAAAIGYIDRALKLAPRRATLHVYRGRAMLKAGYGKAAADSLERAAKLTESKYMKEIFLAEAAIVNGDTEEQQRHLAEAGQVLPDDPLWAYKLGNTLCDSGRPPEGLLHLIAAVEAPRASYQAYGSLARRLMAAKRKKEALETATHLRLFIGNKAELRLLEGDLFDLEGKRMKAVERYAISQKLNPYQSIAAERRANNLRQLGKKEEAMAVMQSYVDFVPSYWRTHLTYSSLLYQCGKEDQAVKEAEKGLQLLEAGTPAIATANSATAQPNTTPGSRWNVLASSFAAGAHAVIGMQRYKKGELKEAAEEAKLYNSLKFIPRLPGYLRIVPVTPGRLAFTEKKGLNDPMTRAALADMLFSLGDLKGAEKQYRKAIALSPQSRDFHYFLMNVLSARGDWMGAMKENISISGSIVNSAPKKVQELHKKFEKGDSSKPDQ